MTRPRHQRKLSRAYDHLQEINGQIARWRDSDPYTVTHEYDRNTLRYVVYVDGLNADLLEPIPLLVGDCLHNLRSGLDHLALELAEANASPLSDDIVQDSEFPIFGDEDRKGNTGVGKTLFEKSKRKIRAVAPAAQADIEALQPYQRGNAYKTDPLWVLYDLARIDRHRLLHVVAAVQAASALTPHSPRNRNLRGLGPGIISVHGGAIENRTAAVGMFVMPIDPDQDVYVDMEPMIDVAFSEGTPVIKTPPVATVIGTLGSIYAYIINDVVLPLSKYL